jgi:hypothetical protein
LPEAHPAVKPAARPGTRPADRPGTRPADRPGTRPEARPGTRTGARTAARPGPRPGTGPRAQRPGTSKGRSRQALAMRFAAAATAALFLVGVTSGATEVALHGLRFFVFRQTGTGETGPNGPNAITDQQFLAQRAAPAKAAAPKAHTPGRHAAKSPRRSTHRDSKTT